MKNGLLLADYLIWLEAELSDVHARLNALSEAERRQLGAYTLRARKNDLEGCLIYVGEFMA